MKSTLFKLFVSITLMWLPSVALAEKSPSPTGAAALAEAAQNPVANMISVPFQNNTYFGIGPNEQTANVLNIQPVIPVKVGDWNIITRTIIQSWYP